MPGKIELSQIFILLVAAVAAVTDLLYRKVHNILTFPAMLAGLVLAASSAIALGDWRELGSSAAGIALALGLYGALYALRVMSAGDVKLLMAFGALGGVAFALDAAILGVFLGGVMAFFMLLFGGRIRVFGRKLYRFVFSMMVRELEVEFPKADEKLTMPFGIAVAAAAIWLVFDNPLARWGVKVW